MTKTFTKLSSINPDIPDSWNKIAVTFDIDWACDEVLSDTIDLVERSGIPATWFVTHDTPLLKRLRGNLNFELGIHPNFNFLLNGDTRNGESAEEVVNRLMIIVPEAKVVRSHSMTQSSILLQLFVEKGLTHDVNHFIPEQAQIELKPWRLWNGLIKIPYFWEDDIVSMSSVNTSLSSLTVRRGLRVFDFHPIHVYLNTEALERYELTRQIHQNPLDLIGHRFRGQGARSWLNQLMELSECV
jgi:hypothetical protein